MIGDLIERLFARFQRDEAPTVAEGEAQAGTTTAPEPTAHSFEIGGDQAEAAERMVGYKRAYLLAEVDRRSGRIVGIRFSSYTSTTTYANNEAAHCGAGRDHDTPDPDCTCGYYALKDREPIVSQTFDGGAARTYPASTHVLTVALYGNVLEGEAGWRASHQSVQQVTLEGNCHRCHGPATRLITRGPQVKSTRTTEWHTLDAICDECAAKRRRETTVDAADVERHLGTLVEFMPAQDRREARLRRWRWLWTPSASPLYALLLLGGAAASGVALLRWAEDGFAGVTGRTVSGALCVVLAQASLMCRFRALTTQNDRAAILYSWAMAAATAGVIGSFVATMLLST